MLSSPQLASKYLRQRSALTSLVALGGLLVVACSSGDATPGNPVGGAGMSSVAGGGMSSTNTAGTAGAGGSGSGVAGSAGNVGTSGGGLGGSPAGGGGNAAVAGGGSTAGGSGGVANGGMGGGGGGTGGSGGAVNNGPFALKSSVFVEGAEIPLKYKCAEVNPVGMNQSPPLSWGPGPAGTKSYAIVLIHVTTPEHWVIWDIPASVTSLPENIDHVAAPPIPAGSKQSLANLDGFSGSGYLGPCPQAVGSVQQYRFTLYALDVDTVPGLTATSTPTAAANEVKKHLVQGSQGVSLTGTQIRMP